MQKLTIIADDLTGANDTGIQFSKNGCTTMVIFDPENIEALSPDKEVWSINSDTRNLSRAQAYSIVYKLAMSLRKGRTQQIYKKIDSTLRGHPGAEIEALMDAWEAPLAFVVPAFPANSRVVRDGSVYVNQTLICHVPTVLQSEMSRKIGLIELDEIRQGTFYLRKQIIKAKKDKQVLVFDAVTEQDLETISQTISQLPNKVIIAGSAGLASYLSPFRSERILDDTIPPTGIIMVVAGSHNSMTASQIKELASHIGQKPIWVNTNNILNGYLDFEQDRVFKEACQVIDYQCIILAVDSLIQTSGQSIQKDVSSIVAVLGDIVKTIVSRVKPKALVVTGGDTSLQICKTLGADGIRLTRELLRGIPLGYLVGGIADGTPIITKSGGFGRHDSFVQLVNQLDWNMKK